MKGIARATRRFTGLLFVSSTSFAAACGNSGGDTGAAVAQATSKATNWVANDTAVWNAVDKAMGRSGKIQPGDVYKYSMPRGDLQVRIGNVALKPAFALGSWVAFKRQGEDAIAAGDLVLSETEIAPVMSRLQEMGVEQTALHNHLLHESPRVMYLHLHGKGDPVKIARAIHAALALTKTPPAKPESSGPAGKPGLDTAAIAHTLGYPGKESGGVFQVSIARAEPIHADGIELPPSMGVATAINFQPTGGGEAAVTGDFVMTAGEVNPVLKRLRDAGVEVTALHSHMLDEEPRLFFAHFWERGEPLKLARDLRSALDQMKIEHRAS